MNYLEEKIVREGVIRPGNILKRHIKNEYCYSFAVTTVTM